MKRSLTAFVLAVLMLVTALPASAQQNTFYGDNFRPATSGTATSIGPSSTSGCSILSNGELSCTQAHTDGYVFLSAWDGAVTCKDANNTNQFIATRVSSNDWALTHPNGTINATTAINCVASLNSWLQRVGGTKGVKITSVDLVYQISGAALTTHNFACNSLASGNQTSCLGGLSTGVYANNTANVIGATIATAPTLALATQTNPYLTNAVVASPVFLPSNLRTAATLEWQAVPAVNTVYKVYGLGVNFSVLSE